MMNQWMKCCLFIKLYQQHGRDDHTKSQYLIIQSFTLHSPLCLPICYLNLLSKRKVIDFPPSESYRTSSTLITYLLPCINLAAGWLGASLFDVAYWTAQLMTEVHRYCNESRTVVSCYTVTITLRTQPSTVWYLHAVYG